MSRERKHVFLKTLGSILLLLLSAAAIYLFVILLNPQEETAEDIPQPLMTGSPAVTLQSEDELPDLISAFPAPVLCAWSDTSLRLIAGSSYDAAFENSFGRVVALRYLYGETQVDVYSIYPSRAISILGRGDYHMSAAPSPLIAGWSSVRMENSENIRIHIQTASGLYAVIVPRTAVGLLSEIVRPLQLTTITSPENP